MKKLTNKLFFLLAPVILIVGIVNFFVDPGSQYNRKSSYKKVVKAMRQGRNIVFTQKLKNFEYHEYIAEYIKKQKEPYDVAVIGSSRVMTIHSAMFPDQSFFNYSVASALLGDIIGIYELMYERQLLPKKLILGFGPIHITHATSPKRMVFQRPYQRYIDRVFPDDDHKEFEANKGLLDNFIDQFNYFVELFSPEYFQNSLIILRKYGLHMFKHGIEDFTVVDQVLDNQYTAILKDGSRLYGEEERNRSATEKSLLARRSIFESDFVYMKDVQDSTARALLKFIDQVVKDGVEEVIVVVPPYNPDAFIAQYEAYKTESVLVKTGIFFQGLSIHNPELFTLVGDTNPFIVKMDREYFIDHDHITREGMVYLFEKYSRE